MPRRGAHHGSNRFHHEPSRNIFPHGAIYTPVIPISGDATTISLLLKAAMNLSCCRAGGGGLIRLGELRVPPGFELLMATNLMVHTKHYALSGSSLLSAQLWCLSRRYHLFYGDTKRCLYLQFHSTIHGE